MSEKPIRSLSDLRDYRSHCYAEMLQPIQALEEAIASRDSIVHEAVPCVAFVGRYSTGKSMLINALLGKNVVTATSGQESRCIVRIVDGTDSAYEVLAEGRVQVSLHEFDSVTSFSSQSSAGWESDSGVAPRFFERAIPSQLLKSVRLMDTPGLDGRERGAFVDAERGVQIAADLSSACLVVLPLRGFGALEQSCVMEASKRCPSISLVLNMSDELDEEEVLEVRSGAERALRRAGLTGRVFVVSALWQAADTAQRQRIVRRRLRQGFEPAEPIHEWAQLSRFVQQVARETYLRNAQRQLEAMAEVLREARRVQGAYSLDRQAEHALPRVAPTLRKKMAPPMGEAYLDLALKAAGSGKPIPWVLLKNVGVSPQDLAPIMMLSEGLLLETLEALSSLLTMLCREAGRKFDRRLLRLIETNLKIYDGSPDPSIASELRFAHWQSSTRATEFSYGDSLAALTRQWREQPELMDVQVRLCIDPIKEIGAAVYA